MGERSTSFWRAGTETRQHFSWMVRSCSLLSSCRNFCILCAVLDSRFAPTFAQRFFRRRALLCLTGKPVLGSTTFRFEGTRHHPVCAVAFAATGLRFGPQRFTAPNYCMYVAQYFVVPPSRFRPSRFLAILRAAEKNRLQVSTSPLLFTLFRRLVVRYDLFSTPRVPLLGRVCARKHQLSTRPLPRDTWCQRQS